MKVTINDDYAVMTNDDGLKFYYGYEVVDSTNRWCFQATVNDKKVTIPCEELDKDAWQWEPADCLLMGIGKLIERGILKIE